MPTLPSTWPDSAARAISAERRHASASGATHAIITSSLIRNRPDFRKSRRRRSETRSRLLLRRGKQARRWLEVLNIHLRILLPHIWNDARHGARRGIRANGCRDCARTDHNNSASQKERTGFRLHERISPYPFELASRNHSSTDSRELLDNSGCLSRCFLLLEDRSPDRSSSL